MTTGYQVSCGHGCAYAQQVDLDQPAGDWQPPTDNGDGTVTPWAGQPLLDAYTAHWDDVHAATGRPPMACWTLTGEE